jgi:D-alanyl-D-alanine-carboxypeptidase/D-alanyl-D-alanine-endopeptidase
VGEQSRPPAVGEMHELVEQAAGHDGRRHVGLVVGAVRADGERAVAGAGRTWLPDGPAPDADTLFEIGSITKVFTALLLAEAVVRGELALDTPLREVLPQARVPSRDGVEITLEHLATHTSGLPSLPVSFATALRWQLFDRNSDPYAPVDRAAMLAALARSRLRRTPGTGRMAYSNFGAGLLGHALVAAAGSEDYGDLVRERICGPLGMADTVISPGPAQAGREAEGHRRGGRRTERWTLTGLPGAGALRSTTTDVLTFLRAQLRPDDTPLGPAITLTHAERRSGGRTGIGLGWIRIRSGDDVLLWHNGGTGGFRSFAGFDPGRGVGAVALANDVRSCDGTGIGLLRRLAG